MVRYKSERIRWMDVPVKDPKVGDLRCEIRRPGPSRIPLDINLLQRLDDLLYRVLQRMYRRRVLLISTRSQRLSQSRSQGHAQSRSSRCRDAYDLLRLEWDLVGTYLTVSAMTQLVRTQSTPFHSPPCIGPRMKSWNPLVPRSGRRLGSHRACPRGRRRRSGHDGPRIVMVSSHGSSHGGEGVECTDPE
jgi:hypothetical protein